MNTGFHLQQLNEVMKGRSNPRNNMNDRLYVPEGHPNYNRYNDHYNRAEDSYPPVWQTNPLQSMHSERMSDNLVSSLAHGLMPDSEQKIRNVVRSVLEEEKQSRYSSVAANGIGIDRRYENRGRIDDTKGPGFNRGRMDNGKEHSFNRGFSNQPRPTRNDASGIYHLLPKSQFKRNTNQLANNNNKQSVPKNTKQQQQQSSNKNKTETNKKSTPSQPVKAKNKSEVLIVYTDFESTNIPKEALHCHICDKAVFSSKESYISHLEGKTHATHAEVYSTKNAGILQMLRANAKLANMKLLLEINKSKSNKNEDNDKLKVTSKNSYRCPLCLIETTVLKTIHNNSLAHKNVQHFLHVQCCGQWYGKKSNNRKEIEDHKLSLTHLMSEYNKAQKKPAELDEDDQEEAGSFVNEFTYLERLQKLEEDNGYNTLFKLPAYDSDLMSGLSCIRNQANRYCMACKEVLPINKDKLNLHCRSIEHYNNVVQFLQQKHQQNKIKKAEAQKQMEEKASNDDNDDTDDSEDDNEDEADVLIEGVQGVALENGKEHKNSIDDKEDN